MIAGEEIICNSSKLWIMVNFGGFGSVTVVPRIAALKYLQIVLLCSARVASGVCIMMFVACKRSCLIFPASLTGLWIRWIRYTLFHAHPVDFAF